MLGLPIITHDYTLIGNAKVGNIDTSVAQYILDQLKKSNRPFLIESETGRSLQTDVLLRNFISVAESLKAKGVKPNDVIGICSENRLEYVIPIIAVLSLGATLVTLNPLYTEDELNHVMSISRPSKVFCSPFTSSKMEVVKKSNSYLNELIIFNDEADSWKGFTSFTDLIKKPADINSFKCYRVNPRESVAVILCSSGTTGLPKCVDLTHSNIMCFIDAVSYTRMMDFDEVSLGLIPFFHGYGLCILLCCVSQKGVIVSMSRFEEKAFLENIQKYKVTTLCLVPPLVVFLAKHPLVSQYDLSSLVSVTCGAAPLSEEIQNAARKRLNLPNNIQQGYGMTETSVTVTLRPTDKNKLGSVGVVVGGMECKIIDVDTGKSLPPFKEGEICFRGPFIMKGYRNNEKATRETIDSDGWLHTGDIGYYDQDGFLFIVDRLKELIKYKGFQVAPAELEALLLTYAKVKDAAVIGLPSEEAGELPVAFVVKQAGVDVSEEEIKKFIAGKVSPQKRIHMVRFLIEIPKNASGKILRRKLREMLKKSNL